MAVPVQVVTASSILESVKAANSSVDLEDLLTEQNYVEVFGSWNSATVRRTRDTRGKQLLVREARDEQTGKALEVFGEQMMRNMMEKMMRERDGETKGLKDVVEKMQVRVTELQADRDEGRRVLNALALAATECTVPLYSPRLRSYCFLSLFLRGSLSPPPSLSSPLRWPTSYTMPMSPRTVAGNPRRRPRNMVISRSDHACMLLFMRETKRKTYGQLDKGWGSTSSV